MDDLQKEFGGWSDPKLSPRGISLAKKTAQQLKKQKVSFDIILTSPLQRASQSATIIASILHTPIKEYIFLKERNTYGILGGVKKDLARRLYPELIRAYNAQEFIPGAERYEDFKNRVDTLLRELIYLPYKNILCITHGYLITTIIEEFLGLTREDIQDGCILVLRINNEKYEYVSSEGLSFKEGNQTYDSMRYTKFKSA